MGMAREFQKLDLLKRWGVIWEYVVEEDDGDLRITVWHTGRASEPVERVLAGMLGGAVARERVHVVRERPPILASDDGLQPGRLIGAST
jgi:hypothetical protein